MAELGDQGAQALPEGLQKGLSASVKYLVGNFLEPKHYTRISGSLATRWADTFQSLTAAMRLMEQHGVHITPEEEKRLSGLTEMQMIESLVSKMPQQSKEQFQHFFLQLQLIVSTATRVRTALEVGRKDLVEQAMDDADSTGISQYILKMAIVQAGSEVNNLTKQHTSWVKDAESKMSRLVRASDDAVVAKERLAKAQGELATFQANQNEGIKKVLMSLAGGSTTALLHGCFSSWHNFCVRMKFENAIYEEFREQIEASEARLIEAKSAQLKGISAMVERKYAGGQNSLVGEVFHLWLDDIVEAKANAAAAGDVALMEAKLAACADQATANAKKVLMRCGAASEQGMRDMCWHEWKTFHQDYLKNKDLEDAVKAEEAKIAEFMKKHSENAQGLLNNMAGATDTGLLHEVLTAWVEAFKEEKRVNEFAEIMAAQAAKLHGTGESNKNKATTVMERAHEHNLIMLYLKVFGYWKLDTQIEKTLKMHQGRIDGKRQQLVGVQQMFRNFAKQLESNIQQGQDSSRDLSAGPPPKSKSRGMQKDGSLSLPDINNSRPASTIGGY